MSFSKDLVCEAIVQVHENPVPNPELSISGLISHIVFLYAANWNNIDNTSCGLLQSLALLACLSNIPGFGRALFGNRTVR
jgi:hypothetical protein